MDVALRARRRYPQRGFAATLRRPVTQLQILLVVAMLFGGGGVGYGLSNAVVQLCALLILGLNYEGVRGFARHAPWPVLGLVGITLLLPLIQLIPLPPILWTSLPGRDLVVQSYALVGNPSDMWSPWSLDPSRTLTSLVGTIVPFTMLVLGWSLPGEDRNRLLWTLVWAALSGVLFGVFQITGVIPLLYETNDAGMVKVIHAMFANRNSTGVFFDVALTLACVFPVNSDQPMALARRAAIIALLALGVIGTMSRSSTALLVVPICLLLVRSWATRSHWQASMMRGPRLLRWWPLMLGLLVALSLGMVTASGGGRLSATFGRFDNLQDQRREIWKDAIDSAKRYWPLGAGTGTFDEVFQVDESLEYVTPRRAGRAHNDYIEMAVESGIFAESVALAWLIVLAAAVLIVRKRADRWTVWGCATALLCFALQSGIDYPLRNQINLCVAGLLFSTCATAFRPRNLRRAA